jgi:hypothetical protein
MAVTAMILSGLGTLLVMLGYVIVKRLRQSRCSSHTSCCDCESPELKLQKEHTLRIDEILQYINKLQPDPESPEPPKEETVVTALSTTI